LLTVAFQPLGGQKPRTPPSRGCDSTVFYTLHMHNGSVVYFKFVNSSLYWFLHDCMILTFGFGVRMDAVVMDFYCTTQMLGFMTTAPG